MDVVPGLEKSMRRRDFIKVIGVTAAAWPLAARAQQQPKLRTVGWLSVISPDTPVSYLPDFKKGLADLGYIEGQNLAIEYRYAEGRAERLSTLANELVERSVDVLVSASNLPTALAAKAATEAIPILFLIAEDPVREGLVASLNRPGGNVTGVTLMSAELMAKLIELMHDMLPNSGVIAVLINQRNGGAVFEIAARSAAQRFGQSIIVGSASTDSELEAAFELFLQQKAAGLVVPADPFLATHQRQIGSLAARHRVPVISAAEKLETGGLISYGPRLSDMFQKLGVYAGKILQGAKPGELPVEQPTQIPLKINLHTAKALGLEVPPMLLARADEVIE